MFSIFTLAIKFDCLFLTIDQRFHLFVGFIFVKLAPPPRDICFKRCFKSLSSPLQCIKQSESAKNVVFFPSAFWSTCQWGRREGYSPPAPPPGYATAQKRGIFLIHFGRQFISPPPLNKLFKLCVKAFFSLI